MASMRSVTALALLLAGCAAEDGPALCDVPAITPAGLPPFGPDLFVAHAGGSPGGLAQTEPYTNSREAFEASYANGFRAFELDLVRLADGEVVVAHDFHEGEYGLAAMFPTLTRAEVEGARWRGKYEVLFGDDLIELMVAYPDTWIVLDTKLDGHLAIAEALVALAPDDGVRDRMVPHLANEAHAAALADVWPFPERMIARYRWNEPAGALVDAMARLDIDNVMMWWDRQWTEADQAVFDAAGANVWVHTPHEPEVIRDFRGRGIGVYSDGWIECGSEEAVTAR